MAKQKFAKGATINDDFTDGLSDVRFWTIKRKLWFALTQETKNTNLHRRFSGENYMVYQARHDEAKAGVGIVIDLRHARAIGSAVNRPDQLGRGIHLMSRGGGLMARYVIWLDVEFEGGARRRLVTFHRAPFRARHLWSRQDAVVRHIITSSPIKVWAGTDSNEAGGPDNLMAPIAKNYAWRGNFIDGFIIPRSDASRGFKSWILRIRNSDHHALIGKFPLN